MMSLPPAHPAPVCRLPRATFPAKCPVAGRCADPLLRATGTLLVGWLDCPTWAAAHAWLRQEAATLLDPLAIALLGTWIHDNEHRAAGAASLYLSDCRAPEVSAYLRWHRRVLWRARATDVNQAWAIERAGW